MIKPTIYTVTTGDYKFGVFALINSLRSLGIDNNIVVGTDKFLPELQKDNDITQIIFDVDWNGTNLKAYTILKNPADYFIYLDADIIITNDNFIIEVEQFIHEDKLVLPVDGIVVETEWRRHYWRTIYPSEQLAKHAWYYNAGFFAGSLAKFQWVLEDWIKLNKTHLDLKAFLFEHNKLPMADQDTFNAILQTLPPEDIVTLQIPDWRSLSTHQNTFFHIGNFRPEAFLHCTGKNKPWTIKGIPSRSPSAYDDLWYRLLIQQETFVQANFLLTFWQHQWFKRTRLARIISKIKRIFAL